MALPQTQSTNTEAIELLYRQHGREMLAVAFRLLQSKADAEDVVHDVFVGLPEALRHYEERGAIGAWLKKVTVRVALMRIRANETRRAEPIEEHTPAVAAHLTIDAITIERALQTLPPALRAVLILKQIEGFSHAEIADMLDISVGASEVRLHRALRTLRALLMKDK